MSPPSLLPSQPINPRRSRRANQRRHRPMQHLRMQHLRMQHIQLHRQPTRQQPMRHTLMRLQPMQCRQTPLPRQPRRTVPLLNLMQLRKSKQPTLFHRVNRPPHRAATEQNQAVMFLPLLSLPQQFASSEPLHISLSKSETGGNNQF